MSGDLAAFIAARLGEDEAVARLAAREGGTWTQVDPVRQCGRIESLGGVVVYDEGAPDENQAPHIARHDPARVLREVAAGRAILAGHPRVWPHPDGPRRCSRCVSTGADGIMRLKEWPCPTLRHLAAVWSDHANYDPEWAPS